MTTTFFPPDGRAAVGITITLEPTPVAGDLRIRLVGELDAWSAPTLIEALAGLRPAVRPGSDRRSRVLLDLTELSFLDTGGLAALQTSHSALVDAGWLVTEGPALRQVARLLCFADRAGWLFDGS